MAAYTSSFTTHGVVCNSFVIRRALQMFAEARESHLYLRAVELVSRCETNKFPVVCVWGFPAGNDWLLEVNQRMMCSGKLNLFRDFLIHSDNEH